MKSEVSMDLRQATQSLFDQRYAAECRHLSRLMIWLMVGQWFGGVLIATFVAPYTWVGSVSFLHVHVLAAVVIGGGLSGLAIWHLRQWPAATSTRHLVAVIQILWTCLLIHLSGGRVETHFHAFASLAILSLYRDWRILLTATGVIAVDHLIRGVWYPQSVFGTTLTSMWRWLEHAGWVVFEVSVLIPGCVRLKGQIWELCRLQVETDIAKTDVERQVEARTSQLASMVRELDASVLKVANQRQFMTTIIESVSGLFFVTDQQGRYILWNQHMQSLLEYSADQMRHLHFLDLIHPADRQEVADKMAEVFETGRTEAEVRVITPSGIHYIVLTGQRIVLEDRLMMVAAGQDISQRRAVELELMEFRQTLDKTHDCVFIFAPDSLRFIYVNEGAARQIGVSRDELLTMTPLDIKPAFDETGFRNLIRPLLERQVETLTFETEHQNRHGQRFPVEVTLQWVATDSDQGKFIAVVRDITRRRQEEQARTQLEEERQRLNRQLVESSRKAGMAEVASGILHNVGNVLNSINVATNTLQKRIDARSLDALSRLVELFDDRGDQLPEFFRDDPRSQHVQPFLQKLSLTLRDEQQQLRQECAEIVEHVEHVKEVIHLQQSLARGKTVAGEVVPAELVRQAYSAVRDSFRAHEVRFEQEVDPDVEVMISDRQRILQILINLITNAKDAVRWVEPDQRIVRTRVRRVAEQIVFSVQDQGVGIAADKMEQIFQFGFTTKEAGNGFGLHYCANCAVELGGKLSASSLGPGRGATFELWLPCRPSEISSVSAPTVLTTSPLDMACGAVPVSR